MKVKAMDEEDVVEGDVAEEEEVDFEAEVDFEVEVDGVDVAEVQQEAEPRVTPMTRAKAVGSKKRKIVHRTRTGRRKGKFRDD